MVLRRARSKTYSARGRGERAHRITKRRELGSSSSKNFLIYTEDVLNDGAAREDADNAAFQLGKLAAKTFALDFRYPINPLQAFAVALTAFQIKHCKVPRATRSGSG